jgi:hypothetical protein
MRRGNFSVDVCSVNQREPKNFSVNKAPITDGEQIFPNVPHLQRSKLRTMLSVVVARGELAVFA